MMFADQTFADRCISQYLIIKSPLGREEGPALMKRVKIIEATLVCVPSKNSCSTDSSLKKYLHLNVQFQIIVEVENESSIPKNIKKKIFLFCSYANNCNALRHAPLPS